MFLPQVGDCTRMISAGTDLYEAKIKQLCL